VVDGKTSNGQCPVENKFVRITSFEW